MSYCQNCGKQSKYGYYCMECGAKLALPGSVSSSEVPSDGKGKKKTKVIVGSVISGIAALILLIVLIAIPREVDEACDWCGRRPSYAYHSSLGEVVYVCADCKSKCMVCGETPETYYENMLGMPVYVCHKCYQRVLKESGY